jgi:hypothetical protein
LNENKIRVAEAYKKGAVEETEEDEPMYNQYTQADVNWVEQLKRKYLNKTSVQPTPPSTEMETDEPESSAMVYIYIYIYKVIYYINTNINLIYRQ